MDATTTETKAEVGNVPTSRAIPIVSLISDPELQPRAEAYNSFTVDKYVADLKDGATFPPVTVAERNGSFVVIQGNNRVEAHRRAGRETIEAVVVPDTGNKALYWDAFKDNTTHGRNYSQDDLKANVGRYVQEGRHLNPDGARKGRRTIQRELLNVRSDKHLEGLVTDVIRELNGGGTNVGTFPTSMPKASKFTPKRTNQADREGYGSGRKWGPPPPKTPAAAERIAEIKAKGGKWNGNGWTVPEAARVEPTSTNSHLPKEERPSDSQEPRNERPNFRRA